MVKQTNKLLKYCTALVLTLGAIVGPLSFLSFKANTYEDEKKYNEAIGLYNLLGNISVNYVGKKVDCIHKHFVEQYSLINAKNRKFALLFNSNYYKMLEELKENDEYYKVNIPLYHFLRNLEDLRVIIKKGKKYEDFYNETEELIDKVSTVDKKKLHEMLRLRGIIYYSMLSYGAAYQNQYDIALEKISDAYKSYEYGIKNNYSDNFIIEAQLEIVHSYLKSFNDIESNDKKTYESVMIGNIENILQHNKKIEAAYGKKFGLYKLLPYGRDEEFKRLYKEFVDTYNNCSVESNIFNKKYDRVIDMPDKFFNIYTKKLEEFYTIGNFVFIRNHIHNYEEIMQDVKFDKNTIDNEKYLFTRELFDLLDIRNNYLLACSSYSLKEYGKGEKYFKKGQELYRDYLKNGSPSKEYLLNYQCFVLQDVYNELLFLKEIAPTDSKNKEYYDLLEKVINNAKKDNRLLQEKYGKNFLLEYDIE